MLKCVEDEWHTIVVSRYPEAFVSESLENIE